VGFWVFAFVSALILIPWVGAMAWRGTPAHALFWREVKLISAFLALVGFFLLTLSFEAVMRSTAVDPAREYVNNSFIELKFDISLRAAIECSKDQSVLDNRNHCFDYTNLSGIIDNHWRSKATTFTPVTNWQGNPALQPSIHKVNSYLDSIYAARRGYSAEPIFSVKTRLFIVAISVLLVLLSVAGSLGESVYQYRQTRNQEEQRRTYRPILAVEASDMAKAREELDDDTRSVCA
jgi:hypothetical protein